jgi:hypothetical protein
MRRILPRTFSRMLRRFRKEEKGSALMIEFVIFVPLLFSFFMMSAEMGLYTIRQMFLDRGLDIAVRHVRLNTHEQISYNDLKDMVCDYAGFIDDCETTLRLEMNSVDPRNFTQFDQTPDCIDLSAPIEPVRGYTLGQQQELMMLRACVKFLPIFPTSGLGREFAKDGTGRVLMTSTAAFVQEPG